MSDRTLVGIFLGYVFGFIFTFGHAYNAVPEIENATYAGVPYTIHNGPGTRSVGAFLASSMWPLYWSAQVWK